MVYGDIKKMKNQD